MRYLKAQEFAEQAQISRWTVYRLIKKGLIPVARLGGALRIPESALADLVEQRQQKAEGD